MLSEDRIFLRPYCRDKENFSVQSTVVATYLFTACFRSYYSQRTQKFLSQISSFFKYCNKYELSIKKVSLCLTESTQSELKLNVLGRKSWFAKITNKKYIYFLFCSMTNKSTITINLQIITLLRVSTLSCHPQGTRNQYLAKLHKCFKCSCWQSVC